MEIETEGEREDCSSGASRPAARPIDLTSFLSPSFHTSDLDRSTANGLVLNLSSASLLNSSLCLSSGQSRQLRRKWHIPRCLCGPWRQIGIFLLCFAENVDSFLSDSWAALLPPRFYSSNCFLFFLSIFYFQPVGMLLKASMPETYNLESPCVVYDAKRTGPTVIDYTVIWEKQLIRYGRQKCSDCPEGSKRDHSVAEDYDRSWIRFQFWT